AERSPIPGPRSGYRFCSTFTAFVDHHIRSEAEGFCIHVEFAAGSTYLRSVPGYCDIHDRECTVGAQHLCPTAELAEVRMNATQFADSISDMIAADRLPDAMDALRSIAGQESRYRNEISLLAATLTRLQRRTRLQLSKDGETERRTLELAVLELAEL